MCSKLNRARLLRYCKQYRSRGRFTTLFIFITRHTLYSSFYTLKVSEISWYTNKLFACCTVFKPSPIPVRHFVKCSWRHMVTHGYSDNTIKFFVCFCDRFTQGKFRILKEFPLLLLKSIFLKLYIYIYIYICAFQIFSLLRSFQFVACQLLLIKMRFCTSSE